MSHNPILDEIHAIREKLLADAGGDIDRYLAGVREREAASGRLLKQGPGKSVAPEHRNLLDTTDDRGGPATRDPGADR